MQSRKFTIDILGRAPVVRVHCGVFTLAQAHTTLSGDKIVEAVVAFMFYALRTRYLNTIQEVFELLEDMAPMEMRTSRALSTTDFAYQSTASAPSLRAREAIAPISTMRPMPSDGDSGNVKVVVRVRKFLKRGMFYLNLRKDMTC